MARSRFQPPTGDLTDPTFQRLYVRAAITDSGDREPSAPDYAYWVPMLPGLEARGVEINHPHYGWDRLIGWQAGGVDVAPYGPYAQPPNAGPVNGWTTPFVDSELPPIVTPPPPIVTPPSPPEPASQSDVLQTLTLARLNQMDATLTSILSVLRDLNARITDVETAVAKPFPIYSGTIFGYRITLTPKV